MGEQTGIRRGAAKAHTSIGPPDCVERDYVVHSQHACMFLQW